MKAKVNFLVLFILFALYPFSCNGQSLAVEISNVRSDKGSILLMINAKTDVQKDLNSASKTVGGVATPAIRPIMKMLKAVRGSVVFDVTDNELKSVMSTKNIQISVFHDEDGNYSLNTDENQRPIEGFARKCYDMKSSVISKKVSLKLYYPINE